MNKLGAILATLAVAGALSACSHETIDYHFAGRWDYEERQQTANCRMNIAAVGSLLISQNGTEIQVMVAPVAQEGGHAFGVCDPVARTLSFNWVNASGGTTIMKGVASDPRTLTGTSYHTTAEGCFANTTWTATLVER